jgi:endonuclease YncB( thermonuclease family)
MHRLIPAFLICLLAIGCEPEKQAPVATISDKQVIGPVTHVRDGDTIEVADIPIRLSGLTCDERGTPLGKEGTTAMKSLITGQRITCDLTGKKSYDREIGRCRLADGRDLGAELISQGVCGRCDRYDPQGTYISAQSTAGTFLGKVPKYCKSG